MFATAAALVTFMLGLRTGGGIVPAWRGLLAFSAVRTISHTVQLPRLLRSLAASSDDADTTADGVATSVQPPAVT